MEKAIIIGGSGFLGTRLISQMIKDFHITNFDKRQSQFFPKLTSIGDIRNLENIDKVINNNNYVILLAAEHHDNVKPISLYYDVNVQGTKNVLDAMDNAGLKKLIFTSSVSVYGLNKMNPKESSQIDPFNHYGKSKWQAEEILREWYEKDSGNRSLTIIRPTVIFGERNRGNVYNLLKQIASGKFILVGSGNNFKSMAYVGNVAAFIKYQLENMTQGYKVYNYVDKPDINMNELLTLIEKGLNRRIPSTRLPYFFGMFGGYVFDLLAKVTRRKLSVSSVRVKKFCATTQFDATAAHSCGFIAPFTIEEGLQRTLEYEFIHHQRDSITFVSE